MGAREALTPYDTFAATLRGESTSLGSLKPTGTTERRGDTVVFEGGRGGTDGPQVFEISAEELDGASSFDFRSIPERAAVLVNVTGGQSVGISPMSVGFNGDRVDVYDSARFGEAASRILYNFEAAPSLTLGGGGNFMGSILAPKASADLTAGTNGRVYVGGDLRTHGTGNETHNYPWTGTSTFSCKPSPGGPSATPTQPLPTTPAPSATGPSEEPPATPETTPSGPSVPSTPPTEGGSAPAAPGTPTPSPSATGHGDGSLATTGANFTPYAAAAAVLAAVGAAILVLTRRRRANAARR